MECRPLKQSQRIDLIDALRGFALLGILMVNMLLMNQPVLTMTVGPDPDASLVQIMAESFIKFFFEGKFYVIFSMLFGFGFYIFLSKGKDTGKSTLPVFRRRLFILLLIGLAHIGLLWAGDILVYYALFGFLLILFRKLSDKKIIIWATVLALVPTVLYAIMVLMISFFSKSPEIKTVIDEQMHQSVLDMNQFIEEATLIYSSGSFSEIVSIRLGEYLSLLGSSLFFFCPVVLAMFLVGYLAGRKGIMVNYADKLRLFKKIFWWGLVIGVITNVFYTVAYRNTVLSVPDGWGLLTSSMHSIGGISLGLCYISGLTILFIRGKAGLLIKYFVPIGRMALTNYLLQSIIAAVLFHSYGFGLFGKVEVWQSIVLTLIVFALQVMFSRWWLSQFQFGPFEWLWRSLTYLKLQPMKKIVL